MLKSAPTGNIGCGAADAYGLTPGCVGRTFTCRTPPLASAFSRPELRSIAMRSLMELVVICFEESATIGFGSGASSLFLPGRGGFGAAGFGATAAGRGDGDGDGEGDCDGAPCHTWRAGGDSSLLSGEGAGGEAAISSCARSGDSDWSCESSLSRFGGGGVKEGTAGHLWTRRLGPTGRALGLRGRRMTRVTTLGRRK